MMGKGYTGSIYNNYSKQRQGDDLSLFYIKSNIFVLHDIDRVSIHRALQWIVLESSTQHSHKDLSKG